MSLNAPSKYSASNLTKDRLQKAYNGLHTEAEELDSLRLRQEKTIAELREQIAAFEGRLAAASLNAFERGVESGRRSLSVTVEHAAKVTVEGVPLAPTGTGATGGGSGGYTLMGELYP